MGRGANDTVKHATGLAALRGRRRGVNSREKLTLRTAREAYQARLAAEAAQAAFDKVSPNHPAYEQLSTALKEAESDLAYAEAEAGGRTYRLPEGGREQLEKRLEKFSRRASRIGVDPVVVHRIAVENRTKIINGVSVVQPFEYVVVQSPTAEFDEWKFAAVLDHHRDDDGSEHTMVRRVPGHDDVVDLSAYFDATARCEHCDATRRRNDTYVVVGPDGRTMQVGSSCLKAVTGHENPHAFARLAEDLLAVDQETREAERQPSSASGGGAPARQELRFGIEDYVASCAAQQRSDGRFVSRSQDREFSTATQAFDRLAGIVRGVRTSDITDEDREQAREAIAWARGLAGRTDIDDFTANLASACSADSVSAKRAGTVAYVLRAREREREQAAKQAARAQRAKVGHFGVEKQRCEVRATVTGYREKIDYGYGKTTYIYSLRSEEGHEMVWFASRPVLNEGETYNLKATVKRHGEFNDAPQTVLTRCTVVD